MGIVTRVNKKGEERHTAQIRIKRGTVEHTESQTFAKYRDAERWYHRRMHELEQPGALRRAAAGGKTVGDLIRRYIDEFAPPGKYGRSKQFDLQKLLTADIAGYQADTLQASDFVDHIRWRLGQGVKPQTANNDLVWLRVVLTTAKTAFGVDVDLSAIDEAAMLCKKHRMIARPDRRTRRPTLDELNAILALFADRDGRASLPMVDITLFALFSARRQEEITKLRWADYDKASKTVIVRDAKDPRTKKGNDLLTTLTPEAIAIIERQPKTGELIFPYNGRSVGAAFTRACNFLEIDVLVFHSLRHECISWLFECHWQIQHVALVSGHKSWATLQRYTHLRGPEMIDKYKGWEWRPS